MKTVYLDHNATTPVHPEVFEAMKPYFTEKFGNASSIYSIGREAKAGLEEAREKTASILGCKPAEIYFTSGGTESDNFAIKGIAFANRKRGKHIITSPIEHHADERSCEFLEKEGFEITTLGVDPEGLVDPGELANALRKDTILVTIMYANNETGIIQDLPSLVDAAHKTGACFHTDAVQATGKIKYQIPDLGCDLLSISAHKLYGPKGIGVLYIRPGVKIQPWNEGGGHERGKRAGTESVAAAAAMAKALEIAYRDMEKENSRLLAMTIRFYELVKEKIPDIHLNGSLTKRVPNTLNISFKAIEGESIILSMDMNGISVSSGSACTSGAMDPSHVLIAMGISPDLAHGSIRFSFGRANREEDVDYTVEVLAREVERLRNISPLYSQSRA